MGQGNADRESPETPVVFPAIPWLRDGTEYDAYLESALAHASDQDVDAELLSIYLTETIDDDIVITRQNQMDLVTSKLNEIIDVCPDEATHIWFLNADNEVPPNALKLLLWNNADVASGVSPLRQNWMWSTAVQWVPAPTPTIMGSTPYFKPIRLLDIKGKIIGDRQMVASGHFCLLIEKHVFDKIRFRWKEYKMRRCPSCETEVKCLKQPYGSEYTFWMDAFMLGYKCRIDGRVVCGHLPQFPLKDFVK